MMSQVIRTICDGHEDDEHDGVSLPPISLDGGTTFYVIDLCELGDKELVEPLRDLIAEVGRRVDGDDLEALRVKRGRRPGGPTSSQAPPSQVRTSVRIECPHCGKLRARGSFPQHLTGQHPEEKRTLPQIEAELGHTLDGLPIKATCDTCGGGFAERAGLSQHERVGGCSPAPKQPRKRTAKAS